MSIELSQSLKQLQIWTAHSPSSEDEEFNEKVRQTYLECQKELSQLSTALETERKEKINAFVHSSAVMERFLNSDVAKSVFPALGDVQLQLHEQEKSHGLQWLPHIVQMSEVDEDVKEGCLTLLVPLQDKIVWVLDALKRNPPYAKELIAFLLKIKNPSAFIGLIEQYEKKIFEQMVVDVGFEALFMAFSTKTVEKFIPLYQKDSVFAKQLILAQLKETDAIISIATHSIPLASKLFSLFLLYPPEIRKACFPFLELGANFWKGGMGWWGLDIATIEKIIPFLAWTAKRAGSGEPQEEIIASINQAVRLVSDNRAIGSILLGLPEEKQFLWKIVCDQTPQLKKMTLLDVQKICGEQNEAELFIEQFEPWNGKIWISTLCSLSSDTQNILSSWVDPFVAKASTLTLAEKLAKLPVEMRKLLVRLLALREKGTQVLESFLLFAKHYPDETLCNQVADLITAFPADAERIVQFVLKDISRLKSFHLLNKDEDKCEKFVALLVDRDPMLLEFILVKGRDTSKDLIALAQSKPHLLAALVEIDGLVDVNCTSYLCKGIDEESATLLVHNAHFRNQLLHKIPGQGTFVDETGPVFLHDCPFALIAKALKHNQALALEIIFLAQNHPKVMKQWLEESLTENKNPSYAPFLGLKALVKSEEDEKKLKKLFSLFIEKEEFALPLFERVRSHGFGSITHLLELAERHKSILIQLFKQFTDTPAKDKILSIASLSTLPQLQALLVLDKQDSFFQKVAEDQTEGSLSPSLQIELLKLFFPTFSPALEEWGAKLFTLYGISGSIPKGDDLFIQLPNQVREVLFELATQYKKSERILTLFEKVALQFPYPQFLSQFLKAAESNFWRASNLFNFMAKHPDCAPLLIEDMHAIDFFGFDDHDDVAAFLIKHAVHLVPHLNQINHFYHTNRDLILRIFQDSSLSEGEKVREICNGTKKTKVEENCLLYSSA